MVDERHLDLIQRQRMQRSAPRVRRADRVREGRKCLTQCREICRLQLKPLSAFSDLLACVRTETSAVAQCHYHYHYHLHVKTLHLEAAEQANLAIHIYLHSRLGLTLNLPTTTIVAQPFNIIK